MNIENCRVDTYDTTLRDGTQALGVSLSLKDKVEIAIALDDFGVDYIEGGYPLSNPKDADFFQEIKKKNLKNATISAFGMTRRKGITAAEDKGMQALLASDAPAITIVGKSWDLHAKDVLNISEEENQELIHDSVAIMVNNGREVIYDAEHFFDGYKSSPEFAIRSLQAAVDAGAKCLCLCDTNGGSTMQNIADIVSDVAIKIPGVKLGIHCHNDSGNALPNSIIAVLNGATHVQGTINGIGERTGNADLISVIGNLVLKYGCDMLKEGSLKKMTEISRFVFQTANLNVIGNQPFVGPGAFSHKGGMHVHAVLKNTSTYEHIDPEVVGNQRRILISELSGLSNITATLPEKFGIDNDKDAQREILKEIVDLENKGYEFEAAKASKDIIIRKVLGGKWYRNLWNLDHYRCIIARKESKTAITEATVKLSIEDQIVHTVSEGDGPVDSLTNALKSALRPTYPAVDKIHLADYRVRVVNTAAGTGAKVRVVIDWEDEDKSIFGSVGVDENIIDASWQALVDAVEYKILTSMD